MRLSLSLALALLAGTAAPLLAQHAEEEPGGLLAVNPGLTIWTIIVFLVVLAVLSRFAFPKILGAVEAREKHIEQLTAAAEQDRAEAAALAEENRRLLEETRAKIQEAVNGGRASAERLVAEGQERARAEYQQIMERARADVATERQQVLDGVRRDAVDVAIRAAEKLVRHTLDSEDNRRLVREYLAQVEPAPTRAPAGA
ncbi:MAG TPA: F0F1 ATP synthase subunit B [Longimicrobiaceae bacterium]|nr:F0F1 ATP synthase subunit B [Longimicrobiaceae bacterium]